MTKTVTVTKPKGTKYGGLVSGLNFFAAVIAVFGSVGGLLNGASIYGSFTTALVIIISSLVTGLLLGAAAAVVDLLAGIEASQQTANYHLKLLIRQSRNVQRLSKTEDVEMPPDF